MNAIPIKLSSNIIEKIDYLIRMGKYKNRSEAIRKFISSALAAETLFEIEEEINITKINELLELALKKSRDHGSIINIVTTKTAVELVAEGRER